MSTLIRLQSLSLALLTTVLVIAFAGCAKPNQESASAPSENRAAPPSTDSPTPAPEAEPAPASSGVPLPEFEKQIPKDFPVPIYDGFKVKDVMRMQILDKEIIQIDAVGNAAPESVAQFYEAEFKKRGMQITISTKQEAKGVVTLVIGSSNELSVTATVSREGNQTRLILSWGKPKS